MSTDNCYSLRMTHHLVGVAEIAELLGLSRQRVNAIATSDGDFPAPEVVLSAGKIWTREAVEGWSRERGYLPTSGALKGAAHAAFVTSRSFNLPDAPDDLKGAVYFNLWERKRWPYEEVQSGAVVYWYETRRQWIRWKTTLDLVEAFPYRSLKAAFDGIEDRFGEEVDRRQPYVVGKPKAGFCLAYRISRPTRVDLPKPEGVRFSQLGWERGDRPDIAEWLRAK